MRYKDESFMALVETLTEDIANPVNDIDQLLETNNLPIKKEKTLKSWYDQLQNLREEINNWVDEIEE